MENLPKSLHYHGSRRSLARRKLDVCYLWRHSRSRAGCGALLLPGQIHIGGCGSSSALHRFLLPLGTENSDLQHSLLEPGLLPSHFPPCSGATAGRAVEFRVAEYVRLSFLHALPFLYPSVRCGLAAGSQQPRISIRNVALCRSNRPRCRRTSRAGTFFGEQSQCLRLLPVLNPAPSSTLDSWSESVLCSSLLSNSLVIFCSNTTPKHTLAFPASTPKLQGFVQQNPASRPRF